MHKSFQNQKKKDKKNKKNVEQNGFSHQEMVENGYAKGNGHHQNGQTNPTFFEAPEGKETKDMTGFEFESVETNKSTWQMYRALLKVREHLPLGLMAQPLFFSLLPSLT